MVDNWEEEFVRWLGDELWAKWVYYADTPIKEIHPEDYFYDAFVWEDTLEGHDYWSDLNVKWEDYYESA